jgi:small subunit ribosomal protein S17
MSETTVTKDPSGKAATPKKETTRGRRRKLVGRVVNDTKNPSRAKQTVVVEVVRNYRDAFYGKYIKRRKKFHAHDEEQQFNTRDLIEIRESRPLSKTKRWVAIRLIERPPEV